MFVSLFIFARPTSYYIINIPTSTEEEQPSPVCLSVHCKYDVGIYLQGEGFYIPTPEGFTLH